MEVSELGKMKDEMGEGEKIKEIVEKRSPKMGLRIKEKQKFLQLQGKIEAEAEEMKTRLAAKKQNKSEARPRPRPRSRRGRSLGRARLRPGMRRLGINSPPESRGWRRASRAR